MPSPPEPDDGFARALASEPVLALADGVPKARKPGPGVVVTAPANGVPLAEGSAEGMKATGVGVAEGPEGDRVRSSCSITPCVPIQGSLSGPFVMRGAPAG